MFEEVPRTRRGLAGLTARRIVLGPFVIGGGMLLAAVGGSVAVAATMITASGISTSDVPPRPVPHLASPPVHRSTALPKTSHSRHRTAQAAGRPTAASAPGSILPPAPVSPVPAPSAPARVPAAHSSLGALAPSAGGAAPSASPSPAGNATVYVTGWDAGSQRLRYQYAEATTGPNGAPAYAVSSTQQYSAGLAGDLTISGRFCPPAGSRCTVDDLARAAADGFYAVVAIDPADQLHSIHQVDPAPASFGPAVSGSPAPSASPTSSPSPTGSAARAALAPASATPSDAAPSPGASGSPGPAATPSPSATATE